MKNYVLTTILIIVPFTIIYSQSDENTLSKKIIGKWIMTKVMEMSKDVTEQHNPERNRWICFMPDSIEVIKGTFESGRGDSTENKGKWVLNKDEIFIDSDAGEDDDSYWEVTFKDDKMFWKGRRFDFNKRFEIIHQKVE